MCRVSSLSKIPAQKHKKEKTEDSMGKDIDVCAERKMGIGEGIKEESWHTIPCSVPPCCVSLAIPGKREWGCPWLELRQAQGKDMPPEKEIKMNPSYWTLSASCNDLNRES